jgi:hypothetical protein
MTKTGRDTVALFLILAISLIFIAGSLGVSYSSANAKVDTSNDYSSFMKAEIETKVHADRGFIICNRCDINNDQKPGPPGTSWFARASRSSRPSR